MKVLTCTVMLIAAVAALAIAIPRAQSKLTVIHTTHAHPDHLLGLAVVKQAFPDAKIVALRDGLHQRPSAGALRRRTTDRGIRGSPYPSY